MENNTRGFEAKMIYKYWKDQLPNYDLDSPFTDSFFPPDRNSLLGLDSSGNYLDNKVGSEKASQIDSESIEWKRAQSVLSNAKLFDSKIEFSDINQGTLGNCYFHAAIAALTEFPHLISQIFRTEKENQAGYYEIVLFIDGEWQIVIVDDYMPFCKISNNFIFGKPNGNELWAILLEKAWAKVNGGYALTISGVPCDPLAALTGFSTETIHHNEVNVDELWNTILNLDKTKQIMCTATNGNQNYCDSYGLVESHAYTLIGAQEYNYQGNNIRLVRVRNPWGHKEWTGDWSDSSSCWNDDLKQVFHHVSADDGAFYISIEDFFKFFERTYICHILYNFHTYSITISKETLNDPNVYNVYLEEDAMVSFSLFFKQYRFNRHTADKNHPASIVVAKYTENKKIEFVDGAFSSTDNTEYTSNLKKGFYVIWIYVCQPFMDSCFENMVIFRCNSSQQFKFIYLGVEDTFTLARFVFLEGINIEKANEIANETGIFTANSVSFKKTGIGYYMLKSKMDGKTIKSEVSELCYQNLYILPPFVDSNEIIFCLGFQEERILLSMKKVSNGTFSMNHSLSYGMTYSSDKDPINQEIPSSLISRFLTIDLSLFSTSDEISNNQDPMNKNTNTSRFINFDEKTKQKNDNSDSYSNSINDKSKNKSSEDVVVDPIQNTVTSMITPTSPEFLIIKQQNEELVNQILSLPQIQTEFSSLVFSWKKEATNEGLYIGETSETGSCHGRGAFINNDGCLYIGYWKFDDKDGMGTQYYPNGDKYIGEFLMNQRNGKGKLFYSNGIVYEGKFESDKMNEEGNFIYPGNFKVNVFYKNGQLI